jgi:hypothetical protein
LIATVTPQMVQKIIESAISQQIQELRKDQEKNIEEVGKELLTKIQEESKPKKKK